MFFTAAAATLGAGRNKEDSGERERETEIGSRSDINYDTLC